MGAIHTICVRDTGEVYPCHDNESLLLGMARIGRKCIPVGCLNGGCGVCKVVIRSGEVCRSGAMSRAHVSEQEEAQGIVLACRVQPAGAIELEVLGKMKKAFSGKHGSNFVELTVTNEDAMQGVFGSQQ